MVAFAVTTADCSHVSKRITTLFQNKLAKLHLLELHHAWLSKHGCLGWMRPSELDSQP